jgi:Ca-activated chloride channel homolog
LFCLIIFALQLPAQYYLRGEIKNEKSELLGNVKIRPQSDKMLYYSGSAGGFGISSAKARDSVHFSLDGYEEKTILLQSGSYAEVMLKQLSANASKSPKRLISITQDKAFANKYAWQISDESYFSIVENEEVAAKKFPNTGFSLNVNKAAYSNIRRFIAMKSPVPPDAVRLEELLNYFNLNYQEPEKDQCFKVASATSPCPWNKQKQLLYVNINARKVDLDKVPPSNLVFLIDASGSMDMPNRLPLVKAAFQMLVKNLRPIDSVAIVIYGGAVAVWMQPTSGADKQKIIKAIEELEASGDTPGEMAIRLAYQVAKSTFIKNGNNRVILATDGDFNVGETTEKALEDLIARERQSGVYLTCLGVGMGNFKDSKLEALAKRGNGNYAYLDDLKEAEKVLVKEMTQTFYSVADNVYLNVSFNPQLVEDYRLVGFDNRREALGSNVGELEGGDIGSGNSVLAIFEITPAAGATGENLANISLRYTPVHNRVEQHLHYTCTATLQPFEQLNKDLQFGSAVAFFGLKLRQSKYLPSSATWEEIEKLAQATHNPNEYLQKEFVQLVQQAKLVYVKSKSKKKKSQESEDD